jgi:hypothetical protein
LSRGRNGFLAPGKVRNGKDAPGRDMNGQDALGRGRNRQDAQGRDRMLQEWGRNEKGMFQNGATLDKVLKQGEVSKLRI